MAELAFMCLLGVLTGWTLIVEAHDATGAIVNVEIEALAAIFAGRARTIFGEEGTAERRSEAIGTRTFGTAVIDPCVGRRPVAKFLCRARLVATHGTLLNVTSSRRQTATLPDAGATTGLESTTDRRHERRGRITLRYVRAVERQIQLSKTERLLLAPRRRHLTFKKEGEEEEEEDATAT